MVTLRASWLEPEYAHHDKNEGVDVDSFMKASIYSSSSDSKRSKQRIPQSFRYVKRPADTCLSAIKEEAHLESLRSWETLDTNESHVDMIPLKCSPGETTGASENIYHTLLRE